MVLLQRNRDAEPPERDSSIILQLLKGSMKKGKGKRKPAEGDQRGTWVHGHAMVFCLHWGGHHVS